MILCDSSLCAPLYRVWLYGAGDYIQPRDDSVGFDYAILILQTLISAFSYSPISPCAP